MPNTKGHIQKGEHLSEATEFKPGAHWREHKPFWDKAWLEEEYVHKGRSSSEIAADFGLTAPAILFWLRKHQIPRRAISETRAVKHWGAIGEANPMYGKRGPLAAAWKGGIAPERQHVYGRSEWRQVAQAVWKRDGGRCQDCGTTEQPSKRLHIHHIVPFEVVELQTELENLILLCAKCHRKRHPPWNKKKGGAKSGDARSPGEQEPVGH